MNLFARSARAAAECSRGTIARLRALPDLWAAELRPRAESAAAALIQAFHDHPIVSAAEMEERSGSMASQAYRAIDHLTEAGYIQELTGRK